MQSITVDWTKAEEVKGNTFTDKNKKNKKQKKPKLTQVKDTSRKCNLSILVVHLQFNQSIAHLEYWELKLEFKGVYILIQV